MNQATAQIVLTLILLAGAVIFVILDHDQLAVGLVGAVIGQGASTGVRTAINGNGKK